MKIKIVERNEDECTHESDLVHSTGITCEEAEEMAKACHIFESDPLHKELWH